jgi:hypothetical protein
MIEYGLEFLLHVADCDDRLTESIATLIARVRDAQPAPREQLSTSVSGS